MANNIPSGSFQPMFETGTASVSAGIDHMKNITRSTKVEKPVRDMTTSMLQTNQKQEQSQLIDIDADLDISRQDPKDRGSIIDIVA